MSGVICWNAASARARGWHFSIRHQVFVEEQQVMSLTDVDDWDREPDTVHVVACRDSAAAGTVRLYRTDGSGRWKGDRLAVLPAHRATTVGGRLVRYAVSTAAALGGHTMDALVQVQNVHFFERIGWDRLGPVVSYLGLPHQPMAFDLSKAAELRDGLMPLDARLRLPAHRNDPSPLTDLSEMQAVATGR